MDALLARLGYQAVNYAMRCGIALTSNFAVQQCARLLKTGDDRGVYAELKSLQDVLSSKIRVRCPGPAERDSLPWLTPLQIISPLLDLIQFKYA